jgi:lipid A 3-O-deacylase
VIRRSLILAAGMVAAASLWGTAAPAQVVRDVELRVDNDNFNFWKHRDDRGDHEYTHGMWLALTARSAPLWGRALGDDLQPCDGRPRATACLLTVWEGGQQIYTPRINSPDPIEGERPWAGWLYGAATAIVESPSDRHAVRLELGVIGPPSMAGTLQRAVHELAGFWEPVGWDNQLPFEPGLLIGYRYAHRLEARTGTARAVELVLDGGGSAGNVLTAADAGVTARIGYRVPASWSDVESPEHTSLFVLGGIRGEGYLRNLFLDGSTWRESVSVEKNTFVRRHHVGFGGRHRNAELSFVVTTRTREYATEPSGHRYSAFVLTIRR